MKPRIFDSVRSDDDSPNDIFDREGASGAELIISCPKDMRGMVATWLYYRYRDGNVAQSIYREALNAAWNHDHHQVRQFVRNNRLQLRSMFQQAADLRRDHGVSVCLPNCLTGTLW
jgi:hypothetical protein